MTQTSQTEFYLERMQPTWLLEPRLCTMYNNIVPRLLGGLIGGLVGGLVDALLVRLLYGLYNAVSPTDNFAMRDLIVNVIISEFYYIILGVVIGVVISGRKTRTESTKVVADVSGIVVQPAVEIKQQKTGRPGGLLGGITHFWLVSIWKQKKTEWVGGLLGFLLGGFVGWWIGQQTVLGLPGEIIFALIDGLLCGRFGLWLYRKSSSWFIAGYLGFLFGSLYGLYVERIFALILPGIGEKNGSPSLSDYIVNTVSNGLAGLLIGLFIAALITISISGRDGEIKPAEVVAWSWRSLWQSIIKIDNLRNGLLFGLIFGLVIGVRFGFLGGIASASINALIVLHLNGLSFWLIITVFSGFSSQMLDQRRITIPNLGIMRSGSNGILVGLLFGLTFILVFGLGFELVIRRLNAPPFELPGFLLIMSLGTLYSLLLGALLGGELAFVQHYSLRLLIILFFTSVAGAFSIVIINLKDPTDDQVVRTVYQYYSAIEKQDYVSAFDVTDSVQANYIHNCKETPLTQNFSIQIGQYYDNSYGKLQGFSTASVSLASPGQGFGTIRTAIVTVQEERNGRIVGTVPLWLVQEASRWKIILIYAV